MSLKMKKISELEQLEVLSDNTNVLVEEDGLTKRFSAAKLGAVKTVNGNEPDENGNVEIQVVEDAKYTHAIPTSLSMANAIKRARQLTDVEWTPKGTIPGKKKIDGVYTNYPFEEGVTYKGVANKLFISETTVKTHVNNIFQKLQVNDRTQAVLYAINNGFLNKKVRISA